MPVYDYISHNAEYIMTKFILHEWVLLAFFTWKKVDWIFLMGADPPSLSVYYNHNAWVFKDGESVLGRTIVS